MAVRGTLCPGVNRWRTAGLAADLLCPLHRIQQHHQHQRSQAPPTAAKSPAFLPGLRQRPLPHLRPICAAAAAAAAPCAASETNQRPSLPSRPLLRSTLPLPLRHHQHHRHHHHQHTVGSSSSASSGSGPSRACSRLHTSSRRNSRCVSTLAVPHTAFFATLTTSATGSSAATAASAAASAAAAAGLPPALVAVVGLLPSLGTFLLCLAAAAFLLGSLPAVWAMGRTAARAERLLAAVEAELPDTMAAMRLSGLEVTDCIQELGALGGELTRGVRSTAALASMAEAGVRGTAQAAGVAVRTQLVPAAAQAEKQARGAVESHLAATAQLSYTRPLVVQAAAATSSAVRRLRTGLAVGRLAGAALQAGRSVRDVLHRNQAADQAARQREEDETALREQLEALRRKQQQQRAQQQQEQQQG